MASFERWMKRRFNRRSLLRQAGVVASVIALPAGQGGTGDGLAATAKAVNQETAPTLVETGHTIDDALPKIPWSSISWSQAQYFYAMPSWPHVGDDEPPQDFGDSLSELRPIKIHGRHYA